MSQVPAVYLFVSASLPALTVPWGLGILSVRLPKLSSHACDSTWMYQVLHKYLVNKWMNEKCMNKWDLECPCVWTAKSPSNISQPKRHSDIVFTRQESSILDCPCHTWALTWIGTQVGWTPSSGLCSQGLSSEGALGRRGWGNHSRGLGHRNGEAGGVDGRALPPPRLLPAP